MLKTGIVIVAISSVALIIWYSMSRNQNSKQDKVSVIPISSFDHRMFFLPFDCRVPCRHNW